jgi:acetate---CoA ligase (ADP-forming)
MDSLNLQNLFFPKSIAVVGASNRLGKWGFNLAATLLSSRYKGTVYLINPKERLVLGQRSFPGLTSLPEKVDLAVLAVPADQTIAIIEECGRLSISQALVVASNFKEVGPVGAELEKKLVEAGRVGGVSIVGPNTMGMVSTPVGMEILFMPLQVRPGPVDVISQSGNIGIQIMELGMKEGVGICRFVGSGNEALLGVEDYLAYFGGDSHSQVIVLYLESIRNGEAFLREAMKITPHKPILAIKAGKTPQGSQAARSHSGAVAQSPKLISDLFRQAGIIEAHSTEELIDLMKTFSLIKPPRGNRLAVVTLGGGWGVATTDAAALKGLSLPPLSQTLLNELDPLLPPFWSRQNPLDLAGTTQRRSHLEVLRILAASNEIDALIALGMLTGMRKFLRQIAVWKGLFLKHYIKRVFYWPRRKITSHSSRSTKLPGQPRGAGRQKGFRLKEFQLWRDNVFMAGVRQAMKDFGKPILLVTFLPGMAVKMTRRFSQPIFANPERAVGAMSGLMEYSQFQAEERKGLHQGQAVSRKSVPLDFPHKPGEAIDEFQSKLILAQYGIPVTREGKAKNKDDLLSQAAAIGYPLALKILSPQILHKTEVGGVILSLKNQLALEKAYEGMIVKFPEIMDSDRPECLLVQEMASQGVEVFFGMTQDPHFGPLLVLGLGGILIEVLKDVVFAKPPLTPYQAERCWRSLKGAAILQGFRGRPPADLPALVEATVHFSHLICDLRDDMNEIDCNPVVVLPQGQGIKVLDALIVPNKSRQGSNP